MIAAEVLDAMLQAGCTAEQIVAAVKADAAIEERKLAEKRAKDAERQRKHREKKGMSRDVTVTNGDGRDTLDKKGPQTPKKINPKSPPIVPPKPEEVSDNVWRDFLAHRKRKKADLTETALEAICSEAAKAGWRLEAALTECVARNWQGFKAEWVAQATGPPGSCDPLVTKILARQATGH